MNVTLVQLTNGLPYDTVYTCAIFWNLNWFFLCTRTMATRYSCFSILRTFVMANFIRSNNGVYAFDQCTICHLCANLWIYSGLILHADCRYSNLAGDHSISLRSILLVLYSIEYIYLYVSKKPFWKEHKTHRTASNLFHFLRSGINSNFILLFLKRQFFILLFE